MLHVAKAKLASSLRVGRVRTGVGDAMEGRRSRSKHTCVTSFLEKSAVDRQGSMIQNAGNPSRISPRFHTGDLTHAGTLCEVSLCLRQLLQTGSLCSRCPYRAMRGT